MAGILTTGLTKLSQLQIDIDKNWAAKKIENLGTPLSNDDASRRDTIDSRVADHAALAAVHQDAPALIADHADLAAVHQDAPALIADHAALAAVHQDAPALIADHAALAAAHHVPAAVGGLYGINVEILTGDKTLTANVDKIYQYFDENGADRKITLADAGASAGDRFVIKHNGAGGDNKYIEIRVEDPRTIIDRIYSGNIKEFIFDGTIWSACGVGTGEAHPRTSNVGIGSMAKAYSGGTAIGDGAQAQQWGVGVGKSAQGYDRGTAIGWNSMGYTYGAALGWRADGRSYGVALGAESDTNTNRYSIALGYYSECIRWGETSININGADSDQENNVVQGRFEGTTANATPVEIYCAGQTWKRFTIRPNSALAFKMTIVARDNVANEVAMYTVVGLIKRDGAGNTVLVNCTVTTVYEDDATWDVVVAADDTNEALIITVTGDADNPVQWAVVMEGVETHF